MQQPSYSHVKPSKRRLGIMCNFLANALPFMITANVAEIKLPPGEVLFGAAVLDKCA